jgi:hypothetical protein
MFAILFVFDLVKKINAIFLIDKKQLANSEMRNLANRK